MFKNYVLFVLLFLTSSSSFAQIQIEGIVRDSATLLPVIGANISVKGTLLGTFSDTSGFFKLKYSDKKISIKITHSGYSTKEIRVKGDTSITVLLVQGKKLAVVNVTASPLVLTLPVPHLKINSKELQRENEVILTPSLNRVPGVYMQSGAFNTNRITIRGIGNRSPFSTTKIRAYFDDIPLTTGDGETTIEDIDLSLLHHVDVWKGPTASIYGAGLGGMIHLQTAGISEQEPSSFSNKFTVGSYGLIRNTSTVQYKNQEQTISLKGNFNSTHSDGYRNNSKYDRRGGMILGKLKSGTNSQTTFFTNVIDLKAFIPSSLNQEDFNSNPEIAAPNWQAVKGFEEYDKVMMGATHQFQLAQLNRYTLENKTSVFSTFRNAYESRPFNILDEESLTTGVRSNFALSNAEQDSRTFPLLSIGLELFSEKYEWQTFETNAGRIGDLLSNNEETRTYVNFFAQSNWQIDDHLTLLTGANLNNTSYEYLDFFNQDSTNLSGNYTFNWIFSPRLGLSYQLAKPITFFTSISHGLSPPTVSETLTPDGTINPAIQPEKGWNFELGARGNLFRKLVFELTFYQMLVSDLLVTRRASEDQFIGINAGKTRHRGIELFLDYDILASPALLNIFLSYSFNDYKFLEFIDGEKDFSGNRLTGTPPHHLNLGLDYSGNAGIYGNINLQFVDAFPIRDDNSLFSDAYRVVNIKMGYEKMLFQQLRFNAFAGIQNAFDEKYASMILVNASSFGGNTPRYYYPGLPRNYYAGVEITLFFK